MSIPNDTLSIPVSTDVILSVRESICETFGTMFGNEIESHDLNEDAHNEGEAIIGIISYVGDFKWSMLLCLPKSTAVTMAMKFAGFEIDYDGPDMGDIVAELANIIAGDVVARLSNRGINAALSLPMVVRGAGLKLQWQRELPTHYQSFISADGEFKTKIVAGTPHHWFGGMSGVSKVSGSELNKAC
ncbi:MAG TPA: chemotaxis protein CheX [Blastocatellia bacterium]|nr:chemotaxis protein CheX [Blastocatellia bacterium]